VIKFQFSGIPIDLVVAKIAAASVPDTLELTNNEVLRNLDERCIRGLNGSRVTDGILALVPSIPTFRTSLRMIKMWAKGNCAIVMIEAPLTDMSSQARAICANVMGFPGGVAWAMMVARVCQLFPYATTAVVITKFYKIFATWKWPDPVLLCEIEGHPLGLKVWNPRVNIKFHLLHVLA